MWQLIDIAYVIPVTTLIGWSISKYLLAGQHFTTTILAGAGCGFVLTIYKIKNYADKVNRETLAKLKNKTK